MSDPADPNRTPPGAPVPPAGSSMPPAPPVAPQAPAYPQTPAGTSAAPSPAGQVMPTVGQVPPPPPPPGAPQPPSPVDNVAAAMSGMLGKMSKGEQLALAGAAVVVFITFLLFGFILNSASASDLAITASVSLLAIVWLKTEGRYDIGANYRLIVVLLCLSIAVPAAASLLYYLRSAMTPFGLGSNLTLISELSYWIGGALAAVGGWWVWKGR